MLYDLKGYGDLKGHRAYWETVGLSFNYFIGTGLLALPYGFTKSGMWIGIFVTTSFGILEYVSIVIILVCIERAKLHLERNPTMYRKLEYQSSAQNDPEDQLMITNSDVKVKRGIGFPELCDLFLGRSVMIVQVIIHSIFLFLTLWIYTITFASSMASIFPLTNLDQKLAMIVYGLIVVPASVVDLKDILTAELIVAGLLALTIVIMIGTISLAYYQHPSPFGNDMTLGDNQAFSTFSLSGLFYLLPIAAFAFPPISAIPSLEENIEEKFILPNLFFLAVLLPTLCYLGLASLAACYFSTTTNYLINLNWQSYNHNLFEKICANLIIFTQILNMIASFPFFANSMGNDIASAIYGPMVNTQKIAIIRGISSLLPILAALITSDISMIMQYAGILLFMVNFIFPALLLKYSQQLFSNSNDIDDINKKQSSELPYVVNCHIDKYIQATVLYIGFCLIIAIPLCISLS